MAFEYQSIDKWEFLKVGWEIIPVFFWEMKETQFSLCYCTKGLTSALDTLFGGTPQTVCCGDHHKILHTVIVSGWELFEKSRGNS